MGPVVLPKGTVPFCSSKIPRIAETSDLISCKPKVGLMISLLILVTVLSIKETSDLISGKPKESLKIALTILFKTFSQSAICCFKLQMLSRISLISLGS